MHVVILSPTTLGIRLPPSCGAAQATSFRDAIRRALSRAPRELLLDCSQLTYIDSTGLGLLALAQGEAARVGCLMKLANVLNPHVRNLLTIMQYEQLFPLVTQTMPQNAELVPA